MSSIDTTVYVFVILLTFGKTVFCFLDSNFCGIALRENPLGCDDYKIYSVCKSECDNRQIMCYDCDSVASPDRCTKTTTCGRSQVCLLTGFLDETFRKRYSLKCGNKADCNLFTSVGKKRSRITTAGYCCNHDNCNNQITPTTPKPQASPYCEDVAPNACQYAKKNIYNLCSNPEAKNSLCRATCETCYDQLQCFICSKIDINSRCETKTHCTNGKVCAISRATEFSSSTFLTTSTHTMGCVQKEICSQLAAMGNSACCNTSMCNNPYLLLPSALTTTTTASTTPTTTQPTTTTVLTTTTVTYPTLKCDLDFVQIGGSCYYINPEGRTEIWEDAQVICMALNSHLVTFETDAELGEMKKYLMAQHGNDRHYSYWTGGKRDSQSNEWKWESTGALFRPASWFSNRNITGECLEYGPMYDYNWNDGHCSVQSNFICEM